MSPVPTVLVQVDAAHRVQGRPEPRVLAFRVSAQPVMPDDGEPPTDAPVRRLPAAAMDDDFATWRARIREAAVAAMAGDRAMRGPVGLGLRLSMPARRDMTPLHIGRPTLPVILATVADALVGVVFDNPEQVTRSGVERVRARHGWIELTVTVHELRSLR